MPYFDLSSFSLANRKEDIILEIKCKRIFYIISKFFTREISHSFRICGVNNHRIFPIPPTKKNFNYGNLTITLFKKFFFYSIRPC